MMRTVKTCDGVTTAAWAFTSRRLVPGDVPVVIVRMYAEVLTDLGVLVTYATMDTVETMAGIDRMLIEIEGVMPGRWGQMEEAMLDDLIKGI